jgi:hypothetical protein
MKITNKTRVKVLRSKLNKYLNISFLDWDGHSKARKYMYDNFGLTFTSKRLGVYYFSIKDKSKYSLFLLKHSDLLYTPCGWE